MNPFRSAFELDALNRRRDVVSTELRASLREWMARNCVSQKKMAELLGISAAYLCDVEQGRRDVSAALIQAVLDWECKLPTATPAPQEEQA